MRVPSTEPERTRATSVVPPPTSMKSAPDWPTCSPRDGARHRVGLGHDLDELEAQLLHDRFERAEVHQRRIGVEDRDAQVPALEADRVGDGVAVDAGCRDAGVDEAHVDVGQARLPGDGALGLGRGVGLDLLEQPLQLGVRDRAVGSLALDAARGGEALDQLAGDADDDLLGGAARTSPRPRRARRGSCCTTAGMSATVPDCMCDRPWRCAPRRSRPQPAPSSYSKTSALAYSVPISSARCAALGGAGRGPAEQALQQGHARGPRPTPAVARAASGARSAGPRARGPCPGPCRPCPRPCRRLRRRRP